MGLAACRVILLCLLGDVVFAVRLDQPQPSNSKVAARFSPSVLWPCFIPQFIPAFVPRL